MNESPKNIDAITLFVEDLERSKHLYRWVDSHPSPPISGPMTAKMKASAADSSRQSGLSTDQAVSDGDRSSP